MKKTAPVFWSPTFGGAAHPVHSILTQKTFSFIFLQNFTTTVLCHQNIVKISEKNHTNRLFEVWVEVNRGHIYISLQSNMARNLLILIVWRLIGNIFVLFYPEWVDCECRDVISLLNVMYWLLFNGILPV